MTETTGGVAAGQIKSIVERIERLEEEKASIAGDIREVYAEAKSNGYDVKVLRTIVKLRSIDPAERQEAEAVLDLYLHAIGLPTSGAALPKTAQLATAVMPPPPPLSGVVPPPPPPP